MCARLCVLSYNSHHWCAAVRGLRSVRRRAAAIGPSGGIVDVDCAVDALVAAVLAGAPRAVQDPWGCLGLQRLTGREASRKRYLQLVRRLHPDRCGHPRAGERFALVEEAWRAIEARGEGGRSAG